jgi:hypothetical protein
MTNAGLQGCRRAARVARGGSGGKGYGGTAAALTMTAGVAARARLSLPSILSLREARAKGLATGGAPNKISYQRVFFITVGVIPVAQRADWYARAVPGAAAFEIDNTCRLRGRILGCAQEISLRRCPQSTAAERMTSARKVSNTEKQPRATEAANGKSATMSVRHIPSSESGGRPKPVATSREAPFCFLRGPPWPSAASPC